MDFNKISNFVDKDVQKSISIDSSVSSDIKIHIKETKPDAKCKKVILTGFEDKKIVCFSLDYKHKISEYINKNCKNITKGCDAIIYAELLGKHYILICELKSDHPRGCDLQFKSSKIFIDYLNNLLNEFGECFIENPNIEYILFSTKSFDKRTISASSKHYITIGTLSNIISVNCLTDCVHNSINIKQILRLK